ncbi:hypothetical protein BOTBODRAFT_354039 [Botryobasidium botryosum FD-172 SS1]|uniref:Uncharacterized protein n=1 Tax=Botryobasidium botryosum (strain FD-172 SS1) TaxID=930990 RepID=A0A067MQT2_BOTB1|nr:hypothetical protein BOTBODRAFT_354039 [Botryobasidium botryosum FD-172 SS1]
MAASPSRSRSHRNLVFPVALSTIACRSHRPWCAPWPHAYAVADRRTCGGITDVVMGRSCYKAARLRVSPEVLRVGAHWCSCGQSQLQRSAHRRLPGVIDTGQSIYDIEKDAKDGAR